MMRQVGWTRLFGGLALMVAVAPIAPVTAALMAGAGRAEVAIPPASLPLDGFGAVHDPLQARVLLLASGPSRAAIAVVDLTSIGDDAIAEMKAVVAKAGKLSPADVLVVAGHSFSAPHLFSAAHMPPGMTVTADDQRRMAGYHDAVIAALTRAAGAAATRMRDATVAVGSGVADVNVNRNVPMADGWWLGANDAGYSDKTLGIVRFDDRAHAPIAILVDYAVQSAVMDHSVNAGGSKTATADLGGATVRHVEDRYGADAVSLFLTGAAGDQLPGYTARTYRYDKDGHFKMGDIGDAGFALLGAQGGRLGEAAVRTAEAATTSADPRTLRVTRGSVSLDAQERPRDLQQIKPTRAYRFAVNGKADAPFFVLQIGDIALVGVQPELSASIGADIRRRSPFAHTLVVTMVNGAAKYMPDADNYRKITYEAMNSPFGPGSAEIFVNRILDMLGTMHREAAK